MRRLLVEASPQDRRGVVELHALPVNGTLACDGHILTIQARDEHLGGLLGLASDPGIVHIVIVGGRAATPNHRPLRHMQFNVALQIERTAGIDGVTLQDDAPTAGRKRRIDRLLDGRAGSLRRRKVCRLRYPGAEPHHHKSRQQQLTSIHLFHPVPFLCFHSSSSHFPLPFSPFPLPSVTSSPAAARRRAGGAAATDCR